MSYGVQVTDQEAQLYARKINAYYHKTSCINNNYVIDLFAEIGKVIIKQHLNNSYDPDDDGLVRVRDENDIDDELLKTFVFPKFFNQDKKKQLSKQGCSK